MKILHVYKDYDPPIRGGVERHIALMCRYQRQWAQVEVLVCSRSYRSQRREHEGIPIFEAGEWGRLQGAPMAPLFPWHLKRSRADVVVIHVPNPTAEVAWLLARPQGKLVVRYHSDVVRQAAAMRLYRPLLMRFLKRADRILPTSAPYLDSSRELQEVKERCSIVPLGIDAAQFQHPDSALMEQLKARYGSEFVLFSGMHRYYKGLPVLVRAAKAIRCPVVIAGDGPERDQVMALAQSLGVQAHFPGALSDAELLAHLHACSLFAFPSVARSEAFGISIMEAHACGKAVVATQLGTGVEFINAQGKTGLNVPVNDPQAFAAAVNRLLDAPEERDCMGRYAQARIMDQFQVEQVARKEFELYQEVL